MLGFEDLASLGLMHAELAEMLVETSAARDDPPMLEQAEADMRAIAVLSGSPHKAYEMRIADLTIQEFDEMSLMNLRGVFADRQYPWQTEPQLPLEPETQPKRKKTQSRWVDG